MHRGLVVTTTWQTQIDGWDQWMTAAGRPSTTSELRRYHLRRLATAYRERGPFDLTTEDLVAWTAGMEWGADTRRSVRASLRGFYGWAVAAGRLMRDPTLALPLIRAPRRTPRPTPDEVLVDALEHAPLRERLMLVIAQRTGLRAGEVARVRREDLVRDVIGSSLHVRGKGARERLVPIDDELARILRRLPSGWVFPSGTRPGQPLTAHTVSKLMSQALGPGWKAHTLRHRYATLAYSVERDLRAVQELLGHSQVTTTQIYTLVPDDARRRAAAGALLEADRRRGGLRPAA